MRVLSVVGARPQFVKLAPVASALAAQAFEHVIVHTGQHYDPAMSGVFFANLDIPVPDVHLGVGPGSHGLQTGAMLVAVDGVLGEHQPDRVPVYGDTNSTLAERSMLVGDVMTDVCLRVRDATIHPAENTDDSDRLPSIVDSLDRTGTALAPEAPLPCAEMVAGVIDSVGVVTDSGGLQKEAFLLGRPCTTLRAETEWTETLVDGWNVLVPGLDDLERVVARPAPPGPQPVPYGDGHAAEALVATLVEPARGGSH
jgi:UDP-N-acetylglucosamine 2-epimerase (non-hydrolysing)